MRSGAPSRGSYYALFAHKEDGDDTYYTVDFPDIEGCMTQGDNWDEALAMATDALSGHISICQVEGYHIPAARSHEDLMEDAQVKEALVSGSVLQLVHWPAPITVQETGQGAGSSHTHFKKPGNENIITLREGKDLDEEHLMKVLSIAELKKSDFENFARNDTG